MVILCCLDADLLGGPGLFEDMPMDAPDISNIEAAPPSLAGDDDTITDMPPPPGLLLLLTAGITACGTDVSCLYDVCFPQS